MASRGYRFALQWLLDNDDCEWLDDPNCSALSVSASLVADLFEQDDEKVRRDLERLRTKQEKAKK